jgi:hypothetical protein
LSPVVLTHPRTGEAIENIICGVVRHLPGVVHVVLPRPRGAAGIVGDLLGGDVAVLVNSLGGRGRGRVQRPGIERAAQHVQNRGLRTGRLPRVALLQQCRAGGVDLLVLAYQTGVVPRLDAEVPFLLGVRPVVLDNGSGMPVVPEGRLVADAPSVELALSSQLRHRPGAYHLVTASGVGVRSIAPIQNPAQRSGQLRHLREAIVPEGVGDVQSGDRYRLKNVGTAPIGKGEGIVKGRLRGRERVVLRGAYGVGDRTEVRQATTGPR